MCTDYTNLNKTCPKDNFPLPNIVRSIDDSSIYLLFSIMDGGQFYYNKMILW